MTNSFQTRWGFASTSPLTFTPGFRKTPFIETFPFKVILFVFVKSGGFTPMYVYIYIYIYTPRTQLSPIFKDQPSKTRAQTPIKPRGPIFLVPGVYLCTVLGTKISDPKALFKMMLMFLFPFGGNMDSFPQGYTPEIWRLDIPNMAFQIKLEELPFPFCTIFGIL